MLQLKKFRLLADYRFIARQQFVGKCIAGKHIAGNQDGVALITALLIVSLATLMAISISSRQFMDIRRTGNIMSSDQSYLQALTMETAASHLLKFSRNELQKKFDDREEIEQAVLSLNANALQAAVGEAQVSLNLTFPEARFNVNTLINDKNKEDKNQSQRFRRLLSLVLADIDESAANVDDLVNSLLDWLDKDQDERSGGAEDSVYESKEIPYKAANRMMVSISELQLVDGFSKEILFGIPKDGENEAIPGLLKYVSAIPDRFSTFNINLVSEPKIFMAFSGYMNESIAQKLIDAQPYKKVNDFTGSEDLNEFKSTSPADWKSLTDSVKAVQGRLDIQSSYFIAKSVATLGKSVFILNSLVYVKTDGTKLEVVSRAFGTDGI